jgi:hypothetical protein
MTRNLATLRHWSISLFLVFVTLTGCNRRAENSGASLFPASQEAAEWTRAGDIRTFPAADLWKYIDGEAERYLSAGVQMVRTADYRFRNQYDAVVDIYEMAGQTGAGKIFSAEPVNGGETVQAGERARLYSQSLIFCEGRYLVRITAYQDASEMKSALLVIGRVIEARLRNNP